MGSKVIIFVTPSFLGLESKELGHALAARHSGHRVRQLNRRSRVQIPPVHCHCVNLRKINA
jgi:hypothetical protein